MKNAVLSALASLLLLPAVGATLDSSYEVDEESLEVILQELETKELLSSVHGRVTEAPLGKSLCGGMRNGWSGRSCWDTGCERYAKSRGFDTGICSDRGVYCGCMMFNFPPPPRSE